MADARSAAADRRPPEVLAFAPPYERDGASVITATAGRSHTARRGDGAGPGGPGFDAQMSGSRPLGVFVVRDGRVRWHPALDVTKVITTAELVVGGVLVLGSVALHSVVHAPCPVMVEHRGPVVATTTGTASQTAAVAGA